MRLIITILLMFSMQAFATNYYIDNAGSDGNNGITTGTPWQTVSKVNASTFLAGDSILFKRGGTWVERLIVPSSGSTGNPIIFSSYGMGAKPIITGLVTLTGLSNIGNIWSKSISGTKDLNIAIYAGAIKAKGRYPNSTELTFSSSSAGLQITTSLSGTPNYTGGDVVIRSQEWIIDKRRITSQSGGVINFSPVLTYTALGTNAYFIQNIESVLDVDGEWCFDSTTNVFKVYSAASPTVQVSTIDTLVYLNNKNYITFDGVDFIGANKSVFVLDTAVNLTVRNCFINYSGVNVFTGTGNNLYVKKDTIKNSLNNALRLFSNNPIIDSCQFKRTGIFAGMGASGDANYCVVNANGLNPIVTNNTIDSAGYIGIVGTGNMLIKNNYISNFGLTKDDGGAIYFYLGTYTPTNIYSGSIVRSNVISNGVGSGRGLSFAAGIYLDEQSNGILVDSNSIYNTFKAGLFCNICYSNTWRANNVYNTIGNGYQVNGTTSGLIFKNNAIYTTGANYSFYRLAGITIPAIDSNFYSRPSNENNIIYNNGTTYNLSSWQSATSNDINTVSTPANITATVPLYFSNPSNVPASQSLTGTYISIRGIRSTGNVNIPSFSSKIMYKAITNDIYKLPLIKYTIIR